jgi:hypothetical protein
MRADLSGSICVNILSPSDIKLAKDTQFLLVFFFIGRKSNWMREGGSSTIRAHRGRA